MVLDLLTMSRKCLKQGSTEKLFLRFLFLSTLDHLENLVCILFFSTSQKPIENMVSMPTPSLKLNPTREFCYQTSDYCRLARKPKHKSLTSAQLLLIILLSYTMIRDTCWMWSEDSKKKSTGLEIRSEIRALLSSISSRSRLVSFLPSKKVFNVN